MKNSNIKIAQKRKSPVNSAYLVYSFFSAILIFEFFILWSPIDEKFLIPLEKTVSTTIFITAFSYLNFIYTFLERRKDHIYYAFLISLIISIAITIPTNLYVDGYTKYTWGVSLNSGILFIPIAFISACSPFLYSSFIINRKRQKTTYRNIKKQLSLLFIGSSIVIIIAIVSDFILPAILDIKNFIRIAFPLIGVHALLVFIAVKKYNFLSISIEEVANDLFLNLQDGIILADTNEFIIQINETAKELFQLQHLEFQGLKVSTLFNNYRFKDNYKNYETIIHSNSETKIISLSQATVKQYNVQLGKILIIRDITESKRAEKELQDSKTKLEKLAGELAQANASLEQKVAERTRSLLKSNEQLQREITERIRAEEALAEEKERLSVTLRSIGDGVITTDTAGHVVLLNEVAESLTGWPQAEAVGRPLETVFQILDEKTRTPIQSPVEDALSTDSIVSRADNTLLMSRNGTEYIVAESAAPIRDQEDRVFGVVLVFRDVTERRRIEEELLKADKLESIGVLAGGIAHDFNNILTAIIGNISLAKMYAAEEDKVSTRLANAEKAAFQAQNLTQQLLTFSKGGSLVLRPASVGDLVKDCMDFSLRGSNVRCELELAESVWPVEIDEGQVSQVINNLIINADQSMPEGGIIHILIENVTVEEWDSEPIHPLQKGRYVRISVKDSGVGIPEAYLPRIFDPYFTTKQKGSGLGLFTCYSIVKKHAGHLAVESEEGSGTTFYVYLPASERRVHKVSDKQTVHLAGQGKVLVMEDDETIREVTGEMLGHFGYDITFARDGAEAIDLYRQAQEAGSPFDATIMDLTIPGGMGAKETIAKILEINPQVKAIVASGYANNPIMLDYTQYGFCGRIVKPYKAEELHDMLHRLIAAPDA